MLCPVNNSSRVPSENHSVIKLSMQGVYSFRLQQRRFTRAVFSKLNTISSVLITLLCCYGATETGWRSENRTERERGRWLLSPSFSSMNRSTKRNSHVSVTFQNLAAVRGRKIGENISRSRFFDFRLLPHHA